MTEPEYDTPKTSRPQRRVQIRALPKPKEFCIQFKGISPDTTPDSLNNIIEIATKLETDSEKVVLNESKDCAWVILKANPDLDKLKERINRTGIKGSYPIVSEVPVSSIPSKTKKKPVPVRKKSIKTGKRSSRPEDGEEVKQHEESLIFFKGINPITKEETIRNFVETATKGTIDQIIFNYARVDSVVHVEGDSTPDLSKLRSKIERTGLEGFKPELTEMTLPTSIAVSSLSTIGSLESLGVYFESRHSCGDTILQGPYESHDGICCIVEYENHEVVKRVCMKKNHQLNKVALRVSPCYKCDLGVIWDANLHTVVLPDPVTIDMDELTTQFLQKDCCGDLMTQLEEQYCKVTFTNNGVQLECLITPKIQGFKQLAQDWQETLTNVVQTYIEDTVKKERLFADEKAWNDLMEYFQTEKFEQRDDILTSVFVTSCEIAIIGLEMSVNECFKMLKSKQEEIKKRLNRKRQTFEKSELEVELLKKIKVFEKAKAEIEDLTVEYASDSVTVEAQPDDIKSVKLQMVEVSNYIKKGQWKHDLSTYCVEFVQTNLRPQINKIFEDKGITLVWTICGYNLEFYVYENSDSADSEDEGDYIVDVIVNTMQDTIVENVVPCDMKNVDILQSNEWTNFIEMITEKYEMSVEQKVVVNKVHVYGLNTEVIELQKAVEQFIAKHSVMLRQIDCGVIELKFMKKHKGTFFSDLERNNSSKKMSLLLKGDKVQVCATKAGLKVAEIELSRFSNSIVCEKYVVEKVAVKEVMRDEHEQGTLDKIEMETRCIIQLPFEEETLIDSFHAVTPADVDPTVQAAASDQLGKQIGKNIFDRLLNSDMAPEEREKVKKGTSSMTIQIYSDNQANIDKCKIDLEAKLEKQYSTKEIEDYVELVKTLKQDETAFLDVPALVNINIDTRSGIVTIDGPIKQVDAAIHEMRLKLLKIERSKNEANTAEELSKIVQWHYEEIMDSGDVKAKPYNKEMNYKIEEAYKANKKHFKFESDGHTYVVDFQQLVEYDENDKDDTVRVIRKDILKEAKGALPNVWTKMNDDQNLISVPLDQGDAIYKTIEQMFINEVKNGKLSGRVKFSFDASKVRVLKIERVQNKTLYRQYQAKKKYMTEQKPNLPSNMPIEREVWHGMKPDVIPSIQNHGFNRSYSGATNGQPWYGDGVYFAGDASYTCRDWLTGSSSGKGHMFLVNVLTGQYCKGVKGMRYLPAVDHAKPTIKYDSAVDDPANPFEFVIFNDTQAYPAYLVTFAT